MKYEPLVSVVIPFFSGINWLIEAVDSAFSQTYENTEILIVNDGSSESLYTLKNKYGSTIQIICKKNGGPASARNLGMNKATGKYIAFLDSDDIWTPYKLEKQVAFMEENNFVWSHHSYEMFWEGSNKTKVIDTSVYSNNIYYDSYISFKIQTSCVVVQNKVIKNNNFNFPLEKRYGQDIAFFRQIAQQYSIGYVPGVYSKFRIRGTNAGMRAKVQLDNRSSTWDEIKNNNNLLNNLPTPIVVAYRMTSGLSNQLKKIERKYNLNEKQVELLSKFMYVAPYIIFKLYAKK